MKKFSFGALLGGIALLGGCLSRPSLVKESFVFATPAAISSAPIQSGPVLGIREISIAAPFDSQALNYRTGDFSYERDPYANFLVSPEESLSEPIRAYLRNSGSFRDVTEPRSKRKPDIEVEISVPELYGDFRDRLHPASVLRMRFLAVESASAAPQKVLLQKEYARRIPLHARTAEGLVAGWNEALKQILFEAAADLKAF